LTDPYIIAGYLGCILSVVLSCGWALMNWKKYDNATEEGED